MEAVTMNPLPRRTTRPLAVGTLALVTTLGAVLVPAPATAAGFSGGTLTRSASVLTSSAGCNPPTTTSAPGVIPIGSGAPIPLDNSVSGTVTGAAPGDSTSVQAATSGVAQFNEVGGSLTDFTLSGVVSADVVRQLGSASGCAVSGSAAAVVTGNVHLATTSVLDLDTVTDGTGYIQAMVTLAGMPPLAGLVEQDLDNKGHTQRVAVFAAGDYALTLLVAATAQDGAHGPSYAAHAQGRFLVTGAFKPLGSAETAPEGAAAKYVALPDSLSCAGHSVAAEFTDKAGKKPKKGQRPRIKKATFFVNGAKAKTAKKPNKKTVVTLAGLPPDEVTVSATLKLTGKGKVTVERTYYPCA
jgi:hypothetical protein